MYRLITMTCQFVLALSHFEAQWPDKFPSLTLLWEWRQQHSILCTYLKCTNETLVPGECVVGAVYMEGEKMWEQYSLLYTTHCAYRQRDRRCTCTWHVDMHVHVHLVVLSVAHCTVLCSWMHSNRCPPIDSFSHHCSTIWKRADIKKSNANMVPSDDMVHIIRGENMFHTCL